MKARSRRSPAARRSSALAAVVLITVVGLAGCGSDDDGGGADKEPGDGVSATALPSGIGGPSGSPTATPDAGKTISITIQGDEVTPSGAGVDVEVGQKVTLNITADTAGELHVHSTPEQEIAYPAGTSSASLTIKVPGVVDIEDHALGKVIVQLKVS